MRVTEAGCVSALPVARNHSLGGRRIGVHNGEDEGYLANVVTVSAT